MTGALRLVAWGLVVAAAAGALLVTVGVYVVHVDEPVDALPESIGSVLSLTRHNAVVALWPLALVALEWPRIPAARTVGDALAAGQVLLHGAILGSALAQQPDLWRFLPHLPFELGALALPVAAWITARRATTRTSTGLALTAATVVALVIIGAVVETYLVPLG
ncbi:hypothetical protein DVA67_030745 [Solirubrobacter sp. CPCC 204708]|uniref:Uncharacterized protein n=1 Tax=Solirubrobacter deserti TaxID=2282478 RepID=A0ABT4RLX1_9ACTN|nr:hypothetical protein [Solirubrobacter deserti]MBE2320382.1 hypothetical protein [Solirubrobacter deserti]MDA0139423.1 hypothetical protein [Solirubrobacter deserti]